MSWDPKLLQRHLTTRRFGREAVWFAEVDSTNRWLAEHLNDFVLSGAVVIADHQTAGRGRYERNWWDVPSESLLFLLLIRHDVRSRSSRLLSLLPPIAIAEALAARISDACQISLKWPNDVLLNGLKVCGVLGQTVWHETRCSVVMGVGLNVNGERENFPDSVRESAASVWSESRERIAREILLAEILNAWESLLDLFLAGNDKEIRGRWETFGPHRGSRLMRREAEQMIEGTFEGLGDDGELRLRDDDGKLHVLLSGDVT